mmetsp:Transcript_27437/g.51217  ORF Transcript_27437/g.51217 Transcript_27437/m.51217 type:complete len:109 (-) Transcript_27437:282-608(-)
MHDQWDRLTCGPMHTAKTCSGHSWRVLHWRRHEEGQDMIATRRTSWRALKKKIGINDMQCSDDRIRTTTRRITHETTLSATETVKQVVQAGRVPLGKWQTHLFELLLE